MIFTNTIRAELPPELVGRLKAEHVLDAEGEEQDIVAAMLYLCSKDARFVTGETLRISAGFGLTL